MGAKERLQALLQRGDVGALRPDLGGQPRDIELRLGQVDVIFRALMQAAERFPGALQRHLIVTVNAANTQAHIPAAQLVVICLKIDVA